MVFGVLLTLDGGASIVGQAGRVHEQYEGQGFFRYVSCIMYSHINMLQSAEVSMRV